MGCIVVPPSILSFSCTSAHTSVPACHPVVLFLPPHPDINTECEKALRFAARTKNKQQKNSTSWPPIRRCSSKDLKQIIAIPQRLPPSRSEAKDTKPLGARANKAETPSSSIAHDAPMKSQPT